MIGSTLSSSLLLLSGRSWTASGVAPLGVCRRLAAVRCSLNANGPSCSALLSFGFFGASQPVASSRASRCLAGAPSTCSSTSTRCNRLLASTGLHTFPLSTGPAVTHHSLCPRRPTAFPRLTVFGGSPRLARFFLLSLGFVVQSFFFFCLLPICCTRQVSAPADDLAPQLPVPPWP